VLASIIDFFLDALRKNRYTLFNGDILEVVSPPIIEDGKEQNTKLVWKRVAA
jgi:hypothetical protein